jgi:RNA polymerase sigma-70 factor (ECF subfamily)
MLSQAEVGSLLAAVAGGDRDAFERLYGATCAKVYGVVLRILRRHDLATRVMEDAYQQVWSTAGQFDSAHASPTAWVIAIARARAIDLVRLPETTASDAEPEIADAEAPGALPRREMTDDLKRLLTCIGRLEPDRQRMVLLAYFSAPTRDQLAIKLDMPPDQLTNALRHSLSEIEQCLTS